MILIETKDILKKLRTDKKITQKEVSDKSGVSYSAYQKYESGERELGANSLQKLAGFYGVTTDYLLGRPEAEPPEDPINAFAKNANLKELEKLLITEYLKLSDKQRESVINFMKKIIGNEESRKNSIKNQKNIEPVQYTSNDREVLEQEADEFAAMAREQFLSEKKRELKISSVKESGVG